MKMLVCPECREIILEGELRGSNKTCHACAVRTDDSDLLVMGEENNSPTPDNAETDETDETDELSEWAKTWEDGTLVDQPSSAGPPKQMLRSISSESLPLPDDPIPTIHSLKELKLAPDFSLHHYKNADCLIYNKNVDCLIYTSRERSSFLFWFGLIWLMISLLSAIILTIQAIEKSPSLFNIISSNTIPLIFIAIGSYITYAGLREWKGKLYIDIHPDSFTLKEGIFHRGKKTIVLRSPETELTIRKNGIAEHFFYSINISDSITDEPLITHKDYNTIKATYIMFKTLLNYHCDISDS